MGRSFLVSSLFALAAVIASCAGGQIVPDDDAGTNPPPSGDGGGKDGGACTSMCGGACADLKTDPANCGKCGNACPMGATCVQGSCQCGSTQTKCGNACVDTKTDVNNCGGCGGSCAADGGVIQGGGTWTCANGTCAIQCPMGKTECSGACSDTTTDNSNCGMCGNACTMSQQCVQGMCCAMGETVCGGACTDINKDPKNCGKCGNVCQAQTPVCNGMGTCIAGCADPNEVQFGGKCYYLDGSAGNCDVGYSRASNATIAAILQANNAAWQGKNYKHTVSQNCCVWTSDALENYGMPTHCNVNGPFSAGEPALGAIGCSGVTNHGAGQLTFCGN